MRSCVKKPKRKVEDEQCLQATEILERRDARKWHSGTSHSASELLLPLRGWIHITPRDHNPYKAYLLHHQAKLVDLVDRNHTEEIYWGEKIQVSKNSEELFPNQNFSEQMALSLKYRLIAPKTHKSWFCCPHGEYSLGFPECLSKAYLAIRRPVLMCPYSVWP